MGCQNSTDASETNNKGQSTAGMGLLKKESFRPLNDEDRIRIKRVLDYWFDENYGNS